MLSFLFERFVFLKDSPEMKEAINKKTFLLNAHDSFFSKTEEKKKKHIESVIQRESFQKILFLYQNKKNNFCFIFQTKKEKDLFDCKVIKHCEIEERMLKEEGLYDLIVIEFSVKYIPMTFLENLNEKGKLIVPLLFGYENQKLEIIEIEDKNWNVEILGECDYPLGLFETFFKSETYPLNGEDKKYKRNNEEGALSK